MLASAEKTGPENGQSLVELALVLPLIILILAGALDLARVYDSYVSITNASREGARYGAVNPTDDSGNTNLAGITSAVNTELTNTGITGVTVSAACSTYSDNSSVSCNDAVSGDRITVTVIYPFRFVMFFILGMNTVNVSYSATMPVAK